MKLIDLYAMPALWDVPYRLLQERELHQSISHKAMPTWEEHCGFIRSHPYQAWYLIKTPLGEIAGCVYLSRQREIGIGILKKHRGQGLAKQAIAELMKRHPGRFLANIAPGNQESISLFEHFGAKLIQYTFEMDPK